MTVVWQMVAIKFARTVSKALRGLTKAARRIAGVK